MARVRMTLTWAFELRPELYEEGMSPGMMAEVKRLNCAADPLGYIATVIAGKDAKVYAEVLPDG